MNLAWNRFVFDLICSGAYDRYLNYDQNKISVTFFGSAPGLIWNGGRVDYMIQSIPAEDLIKHVIFLNKQNIGFIFTFNNTQITKKDINDRMCNHFLTECHSPLNGVIIANSSLRLYICNMYPEYVLHASSILGYQNLNSLEHLYRDYDIIVLPDDLNINTAFIKSLKYHDRTEIILNNTCIHKCPFKLKHLKYTQEEIARRRKNLPPRQWQLPCYKKIKNKYVGDDKNYINPENLQHFIELGIRHFKFLERTMLPDLKLLAKYWNSLKCILNN